jgi:hypothetical protein
LEKFKWGGRNEKHAVATWDLGYHLNIWLKQRKTKKICVDMDGLRALKTFKDQDELQT